MALYLTKYEGLDLSWAIIRRILRRNRSRLTVPTPKRHPQLSVGGLGRELPLQTHCLFPGKDLDQWPVLLPLDHLLVVQPPRYVGATIVFTVVHGEGFGGKSWLKLRELRKLIAGFGCKLIQNHKGHAEENAHLERSSLSYRTPYQQLKAQLPDLHEDIRCVVPILLDKLAVQ